MTWHAREMRQMRHQAEKARNNWKTWRYVVWWNRDEMEGWFLWETHHRESETLYLSNHQVLRKRLEKADPRKRHWKDMENSCSLVGWRRGFQVRPLDRRGRVTRAWAVVHRAQEALADYPSLDDMHLGELESEELREYLERELKYILRTNGEVPVGEVLDWLDTHEPGEMENNDGRGACPSTESVKRALKELGHEVE